MPNQDTPNTNQPSAGFELAKDIIDGILETPDALELLFGGSAACVSSDVSPWSSDALVYEKQVYVEDSQLKLLPVTSDVICQG